MFRRQRELLVPAIRKLGKTVSANRTIEQADDTPIIIEVNKVLDRTRPNIEKKWRAKISRRCEPDIFKQIHVYVINAHVAIWTTSTTRRKSNSTNNTSAIPNLARRLPVLM